MIQVRKILFLLFFCILNLLISEKATLAISSKEICTIVQCKYYSLDLLNEPYDEKQRFTDPYVCIYLNNKKFYFAYQSLNSNFDEFKNIIQEKQEVLIEHYQDNLYSFKLLPQEITFIAKHDSFWDDRSPVYVFW